MVNFNKTVMSFYAIILSLGTYIFVRAKIQNSLTPTKNYYSFGGENLMSIEQD